MNSQLTQSLSAAGGSTKECTQSMGGTFAEATQKLKEARLQASPGVAKGLRLAECIAENACLAAYLEAYQGVTIDPVAKQEPLLALFSEIGQACMRRATSGVEAFKIGQALYRVRHPFTRCGKSSPQKPTANPSNADRTARDALQEAEAQYAVWESIDRSNDSFLSMLFQACSFRNDFTTLVISTASAKRLSAFPASEVLFQSSAVEIEIDGSKEVPQ
jgi:hypothetical protein